MKWAESNISRNGHVALGRCFMRAVTGYLSSGRRITDRRVVGDVICGGSKWRGGGGGLCRDFLKEVMVRCTSGATNRSKH